METVYIATKNISNFEIDLLIGSVKNELCLLSNNIDIIKSNKITSRINNIRYFDDKHIFNSLKDLNIYEKRIYIVDKNALKYILKLKNLGNTVAIQYTRRNFLLSDIFYLHFVEEIYLYSSMYNNVRILKSLYNKKISISDSYFKNASIDSANELRLKLKLDSSPVVLFSGNINRYTLFTKLIECAEILQDVNIYFLVLGRSEEIYMNKYQNIISEKGLIK